MGDKGRKRFTVDRKTWLRGGDRSSVLLDDDGNRCCLGFAGQQICGIENKAMHGVSSPQGLARLFLASLPALIAHRDVIRRDGGVEKFVNTQTCIRIMRINDNDLAEDVREAELTKLFAEIGVDVEFVG